MFLCSQPHISAKLGQIREIKVSMESREQARPLGAQNLTQVHKLACLHTMCLCAQAYVLAKFGQLREIKVSMESGKHAGHICAYYVAQTNKLACMHAIFLRSWPDNSANLHKIETRPEVSRVDPHDQLNGKQLRESQFLLLLSAAASASTSAGLFVIL